MQANRQLVIAFLLFLLIETVGYIFWGDTSAAAAALFSLLFSFIFFGFFILAYLSSALYAMANPWLIKVRRTEESRCFNPMYVVWLFENDRRGWAAYTTLIDVLFTPFIGIILYLVFAEGYFGITNSFIGFCAAFLFLIALAWCFYEGFWKPRTREVRVGVPDNVEAKWRDKKL